MSVLGKRGGRNKTKRKLVNNVPKKANCFNDLVHRYGDVCGLVKHLASVHLSLQVANRESPSQDKWSINLNLSFVHCPCFVVYGCLKLSQAWPEKRGRSSQTLGLANGQWTMVTWLPCSYREVRLARNYQWWKPGAK